MPQGITVDVTPVTDDTVRKRPQGYWLDGVYRRLGTGQLFEAMPKTLLDVIGVVEEWRA